MPLYEYECSTHGVFELTRSMQESRLDASCPLCASAAPRILSLPALSALDPAARIAHTRNERSQHEPRVVQKSQTASPVPVVHGTGGRPWMMGGC